jgi:hypothetical protein
MGIIFVSLYIYLKVVSLMVKYFFIKKNYWFESITI